MATNQNKVIVTCALTGSVHTPTMSEYLPITPEEIAQQAIDAAAAGPAMLHLHARNPEDGRPNARSRDFPTLRPKDRGGHRCRDQHHDRWQHADVTPGTSGLPVARQARDVLTQHGVDEFFHPSGRTEDNHVAPSPGKSLTSKVWKIFIFRNTFKDMESILQTLGDGCGTRFEFECYDVGHLYNLCPFR